MGTTDGPVQVGTLLTSNATICEASRLLSHSVPEAHWSYRGTFDGMRVLDLIRTIDAIVLFDRLYYLPALLPSDVDDLDLRSQLIAADLLVPLDSALENEDVSRDLYRILTSPVHPDLTSSVQRITPALRGFLGIESFAPEERFEHENEPLRLEDPIEYTSTGWPLREIEAADSFHQLVGGLAQWTHYGSSGTYQSCMSSVRSMYYVLAAYRLNLPYWPSVARSRIARDFPNYYTPRDRSMLYTALANALDDEVAQVADLMRERVVKVPPIAAIVLDRAERPDDLVRVCLEMRAEFAGFRQAIAEVETDYQAASSVASRRRVLDRLSYLTRELTSTVGHTRQMDVGAALRYIPDAVELAGGPTDPVQWTKLLIGRPKDWLVRWWKTRPIVKLVKVSNTAQELDSYPGLIAKHFGAEVAKQTVYFQGALAESFGSNL